MFRKIGFRLIFVVGLTSIIIIGVFAYISIKSHEAALTKEVERHAHQLSETVINSARYDMMLNQREHIQNLVNTIGRQPDIRDVRILNKEGVITYSSDYSLINQIVDMNAEACYACHVADEPLENISITERTRIFRISPDSSRFLGIITPINNDRSCWEADCHAHPEDQKVLGVLDVTIPLDEVDKNIIKSEIEIIIFAIVAILAVSFLIAFFVRKWVANPVTKLLDATNQVSVGNLNYTIEDMSDDEIGKLAASFNNMTKKLSEARMQLFQSDKLASLGRLAAGVAHEINNPLTGVLTYSSFLLKRTKDNPELQEDLKVIVRETIRSREIVKSLLDFARQSVPKKNKADINEIISRAISVVDNQLNMNKVKIVKQATEDIPLITVDSNQIQQVFINLFVNACDAIGPNGGTITVSTNHISLAPYGTAQIKKAECPKRHNLLDSELKIDGIPSIKVKALSNGVQSIIHLDPIYGKLRNVYAPDYDEEKDSRFVCPECNTSLIIEDLKCPKCESFVIGVSVSGQGIYKVCSTKGCTYEKWEHVDSAGLQEFIEIKISDTGSGISKEDLSKIFEPFFSTKGQKGTGLGLAVIWGIIDNHNGTINVESDKGKGTTFTIRLPLTR